MAFLSVRHSRGLASLLTADTDTSRTPNTLPMRTNGQELAKLYFINSLFADVTGNDLYLAQQVKAAIESSIEETLPHLRSEKFTQAAIHLLQNHFRRRPAQGFHHWECSANSPGGFSPLWARQELIAIFKKLAPYPQATVLVTGLRACICPSGKRWTPRLRADYAEAVAFIQELAGAWSTRRAKVTLLFF